MSQGSSSGGTGSRSRSRSPPPISFADRGSSVLSRADRNTHRPERTTGRADPVRRPYYLAAHLGGNQALLRRNPNYRGTRPHRFEAILYTMAGPTPAAVDRVERGTADYVAQWDPALAPGSPVARRYGRSGDGDERRYLRTPLLGTDYLVFNSRSGLFTDRQIRRAASYALDRPALAAAFQDLVTDQALPPGIPGIPRC